MPSIEERDLRTFLRDRHQWVKTRARLQHTLQAITLNHAMHQGHLLWSQAGQSALVALPLPPYTSQRRTELLTLYQELQKRIQELDKEVEAQARRKEAARRGSLWVLYMVELVRTICKVAVGGCASMSTVRPASTSARCVSLPSSRR